jgi:hypothetical protein
MLATIAAPVSALGSGLVNPSVYLSPTAQPTSRRPAAKSMIHALLTSFLPRRAGH